MVIDIKNLNMKYYKCNDCSEDWLVLYTLFAKPKTKCRYRDLTIEEAYDLRVFTNGSEDVINVWADDLFETKTIE